MIHPEIEPRNGWKKRESRRPRWYGQVRATLKYKRQELDVPDGNHADQFTVGALRRDLCRI